MCERFVDWIFDYVMALPLTCTDQSEYRSVRLLGLLLFVFWFVPVTFISFPFFVLGMLGMIVEETWTGMERT